MAQSRRRGGGDLARLCLASGYIHHGEAPPIDVVAEIDVVATTLVAAGLLGLSGLADPLPIKDHKLLCSLGYRSNPHGALLQAEWLGTEGEVGTIWPDHLESGCIHHGEAPPIDVAPDRCRLR